MAESSAGAQSFLGDVFDQYQNMMQIARCIREAARQCGITSPRILELSRYATNLNDYLPEGAIVRLATHDDHEQPNLCGLGAAPIPDKSFDVCLVTDTYEHIPLEQRPGLLHEMIRVTNGLVLLGSPVKTEIVTRADKLVFDFIWGKYAHRFEPLRQHLEYGLEPLAEIVASLKAQGAERVVALPDNFVYRWIHQILIFFDQQWENPRADLYTAVNRIYNERLSQYDYREPCYRYLMVVATNPQINLDQLEETMQGPCETPAALAEAEGMLINAFQAAECKAGDELQKFIKENEALRQELAVRGAEIERLKASSRFFKR